MLTDSVNMEHMKNANNTPLHLLFKVKYIREFWESKKHFPFTVENVVFDSASCKVARFAQTIVMKLYKWRNMSQ